MRRGGDFTPPRGNPRSRREELGRRRTEGREEEERQVGEWFPGGMGRGWEGTATSTPPHRLASRKKKIQKITANNREAGGGPGRWFVLGEGHEEGGALRRVGQVKKTFILHE
jgi:hypothetical protein